MAMTAVLEALVDQAEESAIQAQLANRALALPVTRHIYPRDEAVANIPG